MQSTHYLKIITTVLLAICAVGGLFVVIAFIAVNHVRGDEFLSFLHADAASMSEVLSAIKGGADNSYTHALLTWQAFQVFGHSIFIQRAVSLFFWLLSAYVLHRICTRIFKERLHVFFCVVFILFSNLGIFLATDGRYYSILFCLALAEIHLIQISIEGKNRLWPWAFIILFAGMLTSPIFGFLQILVAGSLWVTAYIAKNTRMIRMAMQLFFYILISALVYFFLFRVDFFFNYFLRKYLRDPTSNSIDPVFYTNPFRWFMQPHIPGLTDAWSSVLMLVFIIALVLVGMRTLKVKWNEAGQAVRWIVCCSALLFVLMGVQVLLNVFFQVPVWEPRYYAIAFVFVPLTISVLITELSGRFTFHVLAVLSLVFTVRITHEAYKINDRKDALETVQTHSAVVMAAAPCKTAFVEMPGGDYHEFSVFGEMYVRNEQTRAHMMYVYDSAETDRHLYFTKIGKRNGLNEIFKNSMDQVKGQQPCILFAREEDDRAMPDSTATVFLIP